MFAAAGNRVETLHRVSIGNLQLDSLGLQEGEWMPAGPEHVAAVFEPLPESHWLHQG
jgi:16S rRNA pseudouridine516 synthase